MLISPLCFGASLKAGLRLTVRGMLVRVGVECIYTGMLEGGMQSLCFRLGGGCRMRSRSRRCCFLRGAVGKWGFGDYETFYWPS